MSRKLPRMLLAIAAICSPIIAMGAQQTLDGSAIVPAQMDSTTSCDLNSKINAEDYRI